MRADDSTVRSLVVPLLLAAASIVGCSDGAGSGTASTGAEPDADAPPSADAAVDAPGFHDAPPGTDAPASPPKDAASDASSPPPDLGPAGDFESYATHAADALQALYDSSTGLFPSTGWWNSANAITALVDTMARTGTMAYASDLSTTLAKNSGSNFINQYYDDEGWWALAWIDAYDLTMDAKYLSMAKTIFADLTTGWDSTCGGGLWWSKARTYKNAIPNELFLEVAVRLHARTPSDGDGGAGSFLDWANREWKWFDASGMINAGNLVNDGLDASCKNNGGQTWTYNQGVLVGGLVDLAATNHDPSLLSRAQAIADAAMNKLVDDVGVLHEPCELSCGGDGTQFKGVFMRHLFELARATGTPRDIAFLTTNADWVWNAARNAQDDLGLSWSQALDSVDASRQSSALDALNAAVPWNAPAPNLALHKTATANGSCATGQTAAQAVDGSTTTKWCAGATAGAYWIVVDLGAKTRVSRIIVRHAGAGGEDAGWNSKDFTLSTSVDGKTYAAVATVKGNTRSVTIHRFAPVSAQYLRMDISAPQTIAQDPAARVYEIEAYER